MMSQNQTRKIIVALCGGLLTAVINTPAQSAAGLANARDLLLKGSYREAAEAYALLAEHHPIDAALGRAQAETAQGHYDFADKLLKAASDKHSKSARLAACRAQLAFERGDYNRARQLVDTALQQNPKQLAARWFKAELNRTAGKLRQAEDGYRWFITYYNASDAKADAESLHWIGLGAGQYARWKRLGDQFDFLVNELYEDITKAEPNYWPARVEAGMLFLEKFNLPQAKREFDAALAINPHAAEIHCARAQLALVEFNLADAKASIDRALKTNPRHVAAHQLKADLLLANLKKVEAIETLEKAKLLNPKSYETLGRLAACYSVVHRRSEKADAARAAKLINQVVAANPNAGEFYAAMGDTLDLLRKYPDAARFYEKARKSMPQLIGISGRLGMVHMRLGNERRGAELLKQSFDDDPYNVRVKNTLAVLDVLASYATIETEHFVLRFDRGHDEILAKCAARYLEKIYPELVQQFGFEPKDKSLFEFFSRAKNTDGHGWFSARMVGLPYIGTVGACAGKMVAMQSPNDATNRFNWAQVLRHEFVHVLNLQQTDFNIPHWFTEALAVRNEGYPRPATWNAMLVERVPVGDVFTLDTINLGFIRPKTQLDWQMAYCQAAIYADYMVETYGDDSLLKMLAAYRDNLSTAQAIKRSFGVEKQVFETGYTQFLQQIVEELPGGTQSLKMTFAQLVEAQKAKPDDANLAARLAYEVWRREQFDLARKLCQQVRKSNAKHQLAAYVEARLLIQDQKEAEATKLLEASLDPKDPQPNLLALLAGLKFRAKQFVVAARLYELGAKNHPDNVQWLKLLERVYRQTADHRKLVEVLSRMAMLDADDLAARRKLAELAKADGDHPTLARWADEVLHLDVMDAVAHRMLAGALADMGHRSRAIEHYQFALRIDPNDAVSRAALSQLTAKPENQPTK